MSAHPASPRRSLVAAMAAQLSAYLLEPVEEEAETVPVELAPFPVVAVVSAAIGSGATSVARMLGAELAWRHDGAALVLSELPRRAAPPSRAAVRLATGLPSVASLARPIGRICVVSAGRDAAGGAGRDPSAAARADAADIVNAARYLAPVVVDVPPDGSAASVAQVADRVVVVAGGAHEPALLDAVKLVLGREALKVANRVVEPSRWEGRVDLALPDSRVAARAAVLGTRALGQLGAGIAALCDLLEDD